MIFKRKDVTGDVIENKKELVDDSEFVLLDEETKKVAANKKKTPLQWTRDTCDVIKQGTTDFFHKTQTYCQDNKYGIWKGFLGFLSILLIIYSFTLACFPFSYFFPVSETSTTLNNFYFYSGSALTLSGAGIGYLVVLMATIGCWIGHIFMYKKHETHKYHKENSRDSKKNKMFFVLKFLSWICLIAGLCFIFLLIILPPDINQYHAYLEKQEIFGIVSSSSSNLPALDEAIKLKFLQLLGVSANGATGAALDQLVIATLRDNNAWMSNPDVNYLLFYNVPYGGTSSLSVAGIVFVVLGAVLAGAGVLSFTIKLVAHYFNEERINQLKEMNIINFNFNFDDTKENIESINRKLKGVYANTQQKYQDRKNKDTFRKYKKRLVEEGKDTNPDRFTTDVEHLDKQPTSAPENMSIFQALKTAFKENSQKRKTEKKYDNNIDSDKKRMKPAKPEIAVPDEELDEIIDSLDIK